MSLVAIIWLGTLVRLPVTNRRMVVVMMIVSAAMPVMMVMMIMIMIVRMIVAVMIVRVAGQACQHRCSIAHMASASIARVAQVHP